MNMLGKLLRQAKAYRVLRSVIWYPVKDILPAASAGTVWKDTKKTARMPRESA